MSAEKFLSIASTVFLGQNRSLNQSLEYFEELFRAAILFLINDNKNGIETAHEIVFSLSENNEIEYDTVWKMTTTFSSLFWEFSKQPPKLNDLLQLNGWSPAIVRVFDKIYSENSWKIKKFCHYFHNCPSYYDLTWRFDVELARRNARDICEPIYMIKLDLINPQNNSEDFSEMNSVMKKSTVSSFEEIDIKDVKEEKEIKEKEYERDNSDNKKSANKESLLGFIPNGNDNIVSLHLQSDFANLKRMEQEIQAALNSLKTVNSQNLTDYIS